MSPRRTLASVVAATITSGALVALSVPTADAAPSTHRAAKGCVTKTEYKKAKKGMTQAKVHQIFGTKGVHGDTYPYPGGGTIEGRGYKVCTSKKGAVGVSYIKKPGKAAVLASKTATWK